MGVLNPCVQKLPSPFWPRRGRVSVFLQADGGKRFAKAAHVAHASCVLVMAASCRRVRRHGLGTWAGEAGMLRYRPARMPALHNLQKAEMRPAAGTAGCGWEWVIQRTASPLITVIVGSDYATNATLAFADGVSQATLLVPSITDLRITPNRVVDLHQVDGEWSATVELFIGSFGGEVRNGFTAVTIGGAGPAFPPDRPAGDLIGLYCHSYRSNALVIEKRSGPAVQLIYAGEAGATYRVLTSTNLLDWVFDSTKSAAGSGLLEIAVPTVPLPPMRSFRVMRR